MSKVERRRDKREFADAASAQPALVPPAPPDDVRRDLIDSFAFARDLDIAAQEKHPQRAIVECTKAVLASAKSLIEAEFMKDHEGGRVLAATTYVMDVLVTALHRVAVTRLFPVSNPTKGEHLAVCAVGGYGRGEMAPYSDIDLLFLLPYKQTPHTEQMVEFLYYALWDLGLKVGHSTRSVDDCIRQAKADLTIRTALLEARFLIGDETLFTTLRRKFEDEVVGGNEIAFLDAKLAERDARHHKVGDSRYVLEPNVKEGKGGLRDLHSLWWIAKYLFRVNSLDELVERGILLRNEATRFSRDQKFLWTVRCHLHYLTGRPEERLTFEVQAEIGRRMGYTDHAGSRGVERFMKHYFLVAKDVGDLTRVFIAFLEADQKRKPLPLWRRLLPGGQSKTIEGFVLADGDRLNVASDTVFAKDPIALLRLFHTAQAQDLDIHPNALRLIAQSLRLIDGNLRENPEANRLFIEILTSPKDPETALRRMSEAGVLGRFINDFGRVVAQMQYDMYHVYTTDEHTLFAVGILHKIETGALAEELPLATAMAKAVSSRRALYLSVFLHDIAKGRGGDHSELGAKVAERLGPRLGLTDEETETVVWLVRHHLAMTSIAFKRDLEDPKTIRDFVARVQSPERLKLLTILTAADIRAVGPNAWNGWKGSLLRSLYELSLELMSGTVEAKPRDVRIARVQEAVRARLPEFTDEQFESFRQKGYAPYWLSNGIETLARHAHVIRDAERSQAPLTVVHRVDKRSAVTELTVYAADHPGLFSRIAGALSVAGAQIVDARIVTMANGMALDTFWIQEADNTAFARPDKLAKLAVQLESVLSGKVKPHIELKRTSAFSSRTQVFTVPPRVLVDNQASTSQTVIEVNCRDRAGLLFELTRALTSLGLQIAGAKISTYGEKVVDVFFVKDVFGLKIEQPAKLEEIRAKLCKVLEEGDAPASAPDHRTKVPA